MEYKVMYPKLPTGILTLVFETDREYYFAISEKDYYGLFLKKHETLIWKTLQTPNDNYATRENPYVLYIIDGKLIIW